MKVKVRYFVTKAGGRHYWQPSKAMREKGWEPRRLADDLATAQLQARRLNSSYDEGRFPLSASSSEAAAIQDTTAPSRATRTEIATGRQRDQGVYVIGGPNGPVKVGIATTPFKRLSELQVGSADELHLWMFYRDPDFRAALIEKEFKAEHAGQRRRGEWFSMMPPQAAIAVIRLATGLRNAARTSKLEGDRASRSPSNTPA